MKFAGAIAVALAAVPTVFAAVAPADLHRRAFGSEIVDSLKKVNTSLTALDAEILKVNAADVNQLLPVNTAAQNVASTIQTETTNVAAQEPVDIIGALNIQIATGDLISSTQKVSKDIIAIKEYVVGAGVQAVVLQTLKDQKALADKFGATIATKIDSTFKPIADLDQQQIDAALDDAIKAYSS